MLRSWQFKGIQDKQCRGVAAAAADSPGRSERLCRRSRPPFARTPLVLSALLCAPPGRPTPLSSRFRLSHFCSLGRVSCGLAFALCALRHSTPPARNPSPPKPQAQARSAPFQGAPYLQRKKTSLGAKSNERRQSTTGGSGCPRGPPPGALHTARRRRTRCRSQTALQSSFFGKLQSRARALDCAQASKHTGGRECEQLIC